MGAAETLIVGPGPASYLPATWRLILDGAIDGATNMAVDEAILSAVVQDASPPTLRFYAWVPPCLSLGRNQPLADVDQEACCALGVDVVRRPTGGRAILHTDELTYSVALLQADPRATGDIVAGYRRLSEGLLAGLRRLGVSAVQATAQPTGSPSAATAVCFDTPSNYEITVQGRKLVGSAQWRARGGVLQHGTLPLWGDITRILDCLRFSEGERARQRRGLRARATTLEEALGRLVPFAEVAQHLAEGLSEALNVSLVTGELTAQERALASDLRRECYATAEWSGRT